MDAPSRFFAIYTRVSSFDQAQSKEGSLISQEQRCREYMKFKHGDVAPVVYREEGKSAKDTNRPEFQKLVTDIEADRIQTVLCTELSRISRSVLDFHQFMQICEAHDVGFISLREQFDTTTSLGKLMMSIFASFAQFEREQISERTSANMQARARRGLYNGGYLYGYRPRPRQPGYLDVDTNEAKVVNLAFDKYLEIGSYCLVAEWLNQQGYRTREYMMRTGKLKTAARWNKNTVIQMLRNSTYIGKRLLGNGETMDGVWEPIVPSEKFNKVQELLSRNLKHRNNTKSTSHHVYLFSGRIRCMHCNTTMENSAGTNRQGIVYFYYRHPKDDHWPDCPHPVYFRADHLESEICKNLVHILDDHELLDHIYHEVAIYGEEKKIALRQEYGLAEKMLHDVESQASEIVNKLHLLSEEQIREFVAPRLDEMKRRKEELRVRKQALELDLFKADQDAIKREDIEKTFRLLSKDFWLLDDVEKKELFEVLVDKIEIYKGQFVVYIRETGSNDALHGSPRRT